MKYRENRFVEKCSERPPVMVVKKDARESRVARDRLRAYEARQQLHTRLIGRRKRDNLLFGIAATIIVSLAIGSQVVFSTLKQQEASASASAAAVASTAPTGSGAVPDPTISQNRTWTGTLTINGIALGVELDGAAAPQAVASTISLATSGFYNTTTCHRLTTSGIYVLQCGDPQGDGTGGPGYAYGPIENAPADNLYTAGTLAMARQGGNAASIGSQFFIVYEDSMIPADAAGGYTIIGRVTSGMTELKSSVLSQGTADGSTDGKPAIPAVIASFVLQ